MAFAVKKRAAPFSVLHFERWAEELLLDSNERGVGRLPAGFRPGPIRFPGVLGRLAGGGHENHDVGGVWRSITSSSCRRHMWRWPRARGIRPAEWIYPARRGFVVRSDLEDLTRSTAKRTEVPHRFRCLEGFRQIRHDASNGRIQIFRVASPAGICTAGLVRLPLYASRYESERGHEPSTWLLFPGG